MVIYGAKLVAEQSKIPVEHSLAHNDKLLNIGTNRWSFESEIGVSNRMGSLTLELILLGGLFIAATLIVFGTLAAAAGSLGAWLGRSARAQRTMNRIAGGVFAMLAVNLLITQR